MRDCEAGVCKQNTEADVSVTGQYNIIHPESFVRAHEQKDAEHTPKPLDGVGVGLDTLLDVSFFRL